MARSGTNFLRHLLYANNLGSPEEVFATILVRNPIGIRVEDLCSIFDDPSHVDVISDDNLVNGFSLHANHILDLSKITGVSCYQIFQQLFPGIKFIYLYRQNKLRQAISMVKAQRSGYWSKRDAAESINTSKYGEYSFQDISNTLNYFAIYEAFWIDFFESYNISPLQITYEELCTDKKSVLSEIVDFLDVSKPKDQLITEVSFYIQRDDISEEWYENFMRGLR